MGRQISQQHLAGRRGVRRQPRPHMQTIGQDVVVGGSQTFGVLPNAACHDDHCIVLQHSDRARQLRGKAQLMQGGLDGARQACA